MNRRRNWSNQLSSVAAVKCRLTFLTSFLCFWNFIDRRKKTIELIINSRNRDWILAFFPRAELALQLACANLSLLISVFTKNLSGREGSNSNALLFVIPQDLDPRMLLNFPVLMLRKLFNLELKDELEFFGLFTLSQAKWAYLITVELNFLVAEKLIVGNGIILWWHLTGCG